MKMRFLILFWLHLLDTMYTNMITARPTSEDCIFEDPKLKCEFRLTDNLHPDKVQVLEFSKVEWETLDFEPLMESFPKLQNISISEGKVASIIPPRRENSIKVLELRRLLITNFSSDFLQNFPHIEIFNVRDNQLIRLSNDFFVGNLKELYLMNNTWKCSEDLDWALHLDSSIAKDLDKLTCYEMPYPGKPLLPIAHYLKDLKTTCTPGCQCVLEKVAQNITSDDLQPIISVNCSEQDLSELPDTLPSNTRILHLEGNSIENLEPLTSNPIYRGLCDLFLDNNEITSIGVLEGSYWLTHFRAFSLRGNKLTKLPAYALDNALLKNPNMPIAVRLYLGGNPWRCDCLFIPVFQELVLQKYAAQVKDIRDVKCSYVEGDENSLLPIIELTRSSVCRLPSEYSLQEGLDLLNAVLASLIIFIFGKLVYDYYYFKKTGKLPWIATKMP